jgi:hypothetical protein
MRLQISLPITSRDTDPEQLFTVFGESFRDTASYQMEYYIYLGIDKSDAVYTRASTSIKERLEEIVDARVTRVFLANKEHKICSIWDTLSQMGYWENCDCFMLAGDDLKFITPHWDLKLCEPLMKTGYGLQAFWDLSSPGFPTFPVIHRTHFMCFNTLFPCEFESANQGGDPFLYRLYEAVGAAGVRGDVECENMRKMRYTKSAATGYNGEDGGPWNDLTAPHFVKAVEQLRNYLNEVAIPCSRES